MRQQGEKKNPPGQQRGLPDFDHHLNQEEKDRFIVKRIQKMFQFPASKKQAINHNTASTFGYKAKLFNEKVSYVCPCCQLPIYTQKLSLGYDTTPDFSFGIKEGDSIFKLNPGAALYFNFIKMVIIFLLIFVSLVGMSHISTNYVFAQCVSMPLACSKLQSRLSSYNKVAFDKSQIQFDDKWNLLVILYSIIGCFIFRHYQQKIYIISNQLYNNQEDYTILVQNIPIIYKRNSSYEELDYKQLLEKKFKQVLENQKKRSYLQHQNAQDKKLVIMLFSQAPIASTSLCFDLSEMQRITEVRQQVMQKIQKKVINQEIDINNQINSHEILNQMKYINNQYQQLSKKYAQANETYFNLSHFVGKAFISFEQKSDRQQILRLKQQIILQGNILKISEASSPSDINWFNMKVKDEQRQMSTFKSYLMLMVTMTITFILTLKITDSQTHLEYEKEQHSENFQSLKDFGIYKLHTFFFAGLIGVINFGLSWGIGVLTAYQKHTSKTNQQASIMVKNVFAQFLNTAVIIYIIYLMHPEIHPLSQAGIVAMIMTQIGTGGFIQIVLNIIQPQFAKYFFQDKISSKSDSVNMFQIQLNKKMQNIEFNFTDKYVTYISQVYVALFYSKIAPLNLIIVAGYLFIQYWIDKHHLFKIFACSADFNFRLSRLTLKIFEVSVVIFALGNYIFSREVNPQAQFSNSIFNIISLVVSVLYCLFMIFMPKEWEDKLNHKFIDSDRLFYQSYSQCINDKSFPKIYWTSNPATCFSRSKKKGQKSDYISNNKLLESQEDQKRFGSQRGDQFDKYTQQLANKYNAGSGRLERNRKSLQPFPQVVNEAQASAQSQHS